MVFRTMPMSVAGLVVVLIACGPRGISAQTNQPIKIVVPFVAGGITDFVGRLAADYISKKTGRQTLVENRTGSGGTIGLEAVSRAAPDGTTFGLAHAGDIIVNSFMYKRLTFSPLNDLTPIAMIADAPQLLVIDGHLPAHTLREFIAYAKANSGKINYGTSGVGSTMHLGSHLFAKLAGVDLVHVPYRGAIPALTDTLGGRIQMLHISLQPVLPHLQSGALRILAVALPRRWSDYLPDVPTSAEAGLPGYEMALWFALVGPRGLPQSTVDQFNGYMTDMLSDPSYRKRITDGFLRPAPAMTSQQFKDFIATEVPKWERIVRDTGVSLD